jgi:hypothetical protein
MEICSERTCLLTDIQNECLQNSLIQMQNSMPEMLLQHTPETEQASL